MTTGRAARLVFFLILVGVLAAPALAANVTLTAGDAFGASSFNTAGGWDNAAAPSAGNDYFNGGFLLRTPADASNYTFAGDSLTITGSGLATGVNNEALMWKGSGTTAVITVDDLIINGGQLRHGQGDGDSFTLAGNLTVGSNGANMATQGGMIIAANLAGSNTLRILDDGNTNPLRTITFASGANTFNGNIELTGQANDRSRIALADGANFNFVIGGSGVNNSISGVGTATFDGDFVFDLSGASSNPGDSWTIASAGSQTFGSTFSVVGFSQSGDFWTDGTYLFNPANGTLSVSEPPLSWNMNGGGAWSTGTNWSSGSAPPAGADVLFGSVLTAENAPATINLDVPVSVSRVTFSGTNQYILAGPSTLTLTDLAQLSATAGTHEVSAVVGSSLGLTKTGGGTIILSGNNTYTGTTSVQAGTLGVMSTGVIPGNVTVDSGATLSFVGDGEGGGFSGSFAGGISGDGGVTLAGSLTTETVTFAGAKSYTGQTFVSGGTLQITNAGALGTSDGTAASQTLIDGNEATGKLALSGDIAVGTEVLVLEARELAAIDAVHLTSAGNNSWAGNIKGQTGGSRYNIESTSGTLTLSGTISAVDDATPTDRLFVFSGGGDFNITGRITDAPTDADGVITGPSTGDNVQVVKRGAGTMTVGTNVDDDIWFGDTTVEGGTLKVIAAANDNNELQSSLTTVRAGATLDISTFSIYDVGIGDAIAGGGTFDVGSGELAIYDDNSITPGDSVGTLHITGNASLTSDIGGGSFNYEFGNTTTVGGTENDLIAVTGTLTTFGSPVMTLNVNFVESSIAASGSQYTLATFASSGSAPSVSGITPQVVDSDGNPLTIRPTLTVSSTTTTIELGVTGNTQSFNWTGAGDGTTWDVATTNNWSSADQKFFDLDRVTFANGTGQTTVNVAGPVTPGSMTFTNTTDTYTFTGGAIEGSGAVTLNNGATVILATDGTNLSGDVSLGSSAILQQGDGSSTGSNTLSGVVSGNGAVNVESGMLVLTGDNTYSGVTTINGGTLITGSATAMGSTAAGTIVNGGSLRSNGDTYTSNELITLNGGSLAVGGGGPAAVTFAGTITVGAAGGTVQVDGNTGDDGLTVTGDIVGSSGAALRTNVDGGSTMTVTSNITNNGALDKTGSGTLALTGSATITSPTINVTGGTLDVSGLTSTYTVASGQTLNNNSNNTVVGEIVVANNATISGSGTFADNVTAQSGSTVQVGTAGMPLQYVDFAYVDATEGASGNTALAAGGTFTSTTDASGTDNLWRLRTNGSSATAYESGGDISTTGSAVDGNNEDTPRLVTTVGGLTAGATYSVRAFYWNTNTDQWRLQASLTDNPGGDLRLFAGGVPASNTLTFATAPTVQAEGNRTLYAADLGTAAADGSGEIVVYVDDDPAARQGIANGWIFRTWYDGVAVSNTQAPVSATLTVGGDLTMDAGSTLELDIYSPMVLDLLAVTGNFAADGILDVTLAAGAPAPGLGDTFDILDFGTASGAFDTLNLPSLTSGLTWKTSELLTTGILEVITSGGLVGDYNDDGTVDAADYTVWRDNFGADGSTLANRDPANTGTIGEDDWASWKAHFGETAGSGAVNGQAAVPEPSSLWFALLAACCAPVVRRLRGGQR